MERLNNIINIFKDSDSKIEITRKKIYIQNYIDIAEFSDNKVKVSTNKEIILIKGRNLIISKLIKNELLISGDFKAIEFGDINA